MLDFFKRFLRPSTLSKDMATIESNSGTGSDPLLREISKGFVAPVVKKLDTLDDEDSPEYFTNLKRMFKEFQHILETTCRKSGQILQRDQLEKHMKQYAGWFLTYSQDVQDGTDTARTQIMASAEYFCDFATKTTASSEEVDRLLRICDSLSQDCKTEPEPTNIQRNVVRDKGQSHQFIGKKQYNHTGDGIQFNGRVHTFNNGNGGDGSQRT
jgi:hypothetical protein